MTTKAIEFMKDRSIDFATLVAAIGTIQSGLAEGFIARVTGWHMSTDRDAKILQAVVAFAVIWSVVRGLRKKLKNARDVQERATRSKVLQEVKRACQSRLEKALPGGKRIRLKCRWVSDEVDNPLDARLEECKPGEGLSITWLREVLSCGPIVSYHFGLIYRGQTRPTFTTALSPTYIDVACCTCTRIFHLSVHRREPKGKITSGI